MVTACIASALCAVLFTVGAAYFGLQLHKLISSLNDVHDELQTIREMACNISVTADDADIEGWAN